VIDASIYDITLLPVGELLIGSMDYAALMGSKRNSMRAINKLPIKILQRN